MYNISCLSDALPTLFGVIKGCFIKLLTRFPGKQSGVLVGNTGGQRASVAHGILCPPAGPPELQALREASDRRADRHAVLLRVQQRPAVSTLWQPGLPFREAIFLLQSS